MRWELEVDHPEHGPRVEWFEEASPAWHACEAALAMLDAEGFVRCEFEVVEDGVRGLGRLMRGASEATVQLARVNAEGIADTSEIPSLGLTLQEAELVTGRPRGRWACVRPRLALR